MPRWVPDEQLIPAVRTGRCPRRYQDLAPADRAWVVAGLSRSGLTAEKIAGLLGCSLRTVRVWQAEPMTIVCQRYMREVEAFTGELRLIRSEHTRLTSELEAAQRETRRLHERLVRVTSPRTPAGAPLCPKNQHEMTAYNSYTDPTGRVWCRDCHRERQAEHRARKREAECLSASSR